MHGPHGWMQQDIRCSDGNRPQCDGPLDVGHDASLGPVRLRVPATWRGCSCEGRGASRSCSCSHNAFSARIVLDERQGRTGRGGVSTWDLEGI